MGFALKDHNYFRIFPCGRQDDNMKKPFRLCSTILFILAAVLSAVTVIAALCSVSASPWLLRTPASAQERTEDLMELVCQGDFDIAAGLLSGTPDLGIAAPEAGTPEALIWQAWLESLHYAFSGDCYVAQDRIARDVTVYGLDIPLATQAISAEAQKLLEERMIQGCDSEELYDEDGGLSKAFVNQILCDATSRVLESQTQTSSCLMTLYLEYTNGQWMIVPDAQLQAFLSGQLR